MRTGEVEFKDAIDILNDNTKHRTPMRHDDIREKLRDALETYLDLFTVPRRFRARQAHRRLSKAADKFERDARRLFVDLSETLAVLAFESGEDEQGFQKTCHMAEQCLGYSLALANMARWYGAPGLVDSMAYESGKVPSDEDWRHMSGNVTGKGRPRNSAAQTLGYELAMLWNKATKRIPYVAYGESASGGPSPFLRFVSAMCREAGIPSPTPDDLQVVIEVLFPRKG